MEQGKAECVVLGAALISQSPALLSTRASYAVLVRRRQGLEYHDGYLWESTGMFSRSTVRQVDIKTGSVVKRVRNEHAIFGEGLTRVNDTLVQLTWRNRKALLFSYPHLELVDQKPLRTHRREGWGICYDGSRLIASDGSAFLTILDPVTHAKVSEIEVKDERGKPLKDLNELECVDGEVLANVWHKDFIARIDVDAGRVVGRLDFSTLYPNPRRNPEFCLNGIAYDPVSSSPELGYKRLYITGKQWDKMFEVLWWF